MDEVRIERLGGFAGFGGGAHLKSRGSVRLAELGPADRDAVEALFKRGSRGAGEARDAFTYRLTRDGPGGAESVDVPETDVPAAIAARVRDTLE
jgi:hypothetical protein